jgi:hypothetical protein
MISLNFGKSTQSSHNISSLPIGAFSALVIILWLRIPRLSDSNEQSIIERIQQLDLIGASIVIPAIVCLLLALQWGGSMYPWNDSRIIGLFVGFGCLSGVFVFTQIKLGERATVPPRILTQRTVLASTTYVFLFGAGFFVLLFYLPLYFQGIKGVSATRSGIDILPLSLATVLSSMVVGSLITVVGYYTPFLIGGTVLYAIGAGLISTYSVDISFGKWFGYQVLAGLGAGVGFQIPILAVQAVLPMDDVSIGTSLVIFFRTLGSAVFVSVGESVFTNGVQRGIRIHAPWLDPKILLEAGATQIRTLLEKMGKSDQLDEVLMGYMVGLVDSYRVPIACTVAAVIAACFLEWRSVKEKVTDRGSEEDDFSTI